MAKKYGTIRCELAGLTSDYATGDTQITFKVHRDSKYSVRAVVDEARSVDLNLTVAKYSKKRSLDANAYFWKLAGELSAVINIPPEEIYRQYIRGIGDNFEIVPIRNDAKARWIKNWGANGLGWVCEELGDSKLDGYTNVICYFGSSTYDSQQMKRLTELLVFDCKEHGVETRTPDELARLCDEWAEKQAG